MWTEIESTWGAVRVGTLLSSAGVHWEVVGLGAENQPGMTPWIRMQNLETMALASVAPKQRTEKVTVLDTTPAAFKAMVDLVRGKLGAEAIGYHDRRTGAVFHRNPATMERTELANHIVSQHRTAASLTMSREELSALHDRLHLEGGHGASHGHL